MLDPHREIQTLIDGFVARLTEVAKRIAMEQVKLAFGTVKLAPLRSSASSLASSLPALPVPSTSRSPGQARRSRSRRAPREIEALREKLLAVISDNPGCRAEDINGALGTRTPQIAQPLRRLVADQQVRTEGARRGTRYFAAGPSPSDVQNGRRPPPEPAVPSEEPAALA